MVLFSFILFILILSCFIFDTLWKITQENKKFYIEVINFGLKNVSYLNMKNHLNYFKNKISFLHNAKFFLHNVNFFYNLNIFLQFKKNNFFTIKYILK